ncbi:MAG: response regulator transcription factor [Deltaproteobacteria bacterium]|nr:response regulator transcription factor [Deltaproteobacteria bacterium]
MKVVISLGSSLLGKALQEQLQQQPEISEVVVLNPDRDLELLDPDFLITDVYTIKQSRPACLSGSKTVLLDYGLSEDSIACLIITNKINGIMTVDADMRLLLKAFHAINNGQIWIDNCKIKALVNFADNTKDSIIAGCLSNKEREVVMNISQGLTNKEIASQLYISEQTVKTHINSIFKKLNMTRRTQLVPLGIKLKEALIS